MIMMFALYWYNYLTWIFIVLVQWNYSKLVDMLLHSDTLCWFLAKHSLFLLPNAACLAEKQEIQFVFSDRITI
jgi:hypothetical protein